MRHPAKLSNILGSTCQHLILVFHYLVHAFGVSQISIDRCLWCHISEMAFFRTLLMQERSSGGDSSPNNFKSKKGPPLNIFRFLITKNFKHKRVHLESLLCFSINNSLFHETECWDTTRLKYLQFRLQFIIFNPLKVPWNWIDFYENSFVISPD